MLYIKGGIPAKKAGRKSIFFALKAHQPWVDNFKLSLYLWIIGIFLLPNIALASAITPQRVISNINAEREKLSLTALQINDQLTKAAEQKARDILDEQLFAHNFPNKKFSQWVKDVDYNYAVVGENLAINFNDNDALFNAWLASPTHKKNIIHDSYQEVGVAMVAGEWYEEDTVIVVAIFGAPAVAMAMEQTVPVININSSTRVATPLLTSNLAEHYFNNINDNKINITLTAQEKFNVKNTWQNKTALAVYLTMAVKIMIAFTLVMLLLLLGTYYFNYFFKFNKKLQALN